ncbi:hypothetical protein VF724_04585 [Paenibacillaceae bacterium T2]|uniref:Uncharacterized protein n=1 Tax=Ferviditalea candida TaxID=3108399 RepID=A0ABU5ZEM2_9BACL|nr:hypothetical protein [Paenibacillaceae bacterium T2]
MHIIKKYKLENSNYMAIFIMFFILGIIYYRVISGGLWLKWDMYGAAFPLSVGVSDALKHGSLPLWEPFVARGIPIANLLGFPTWSPFTIFFWISRIFTVYNSITIFSNNFTCFIVCLFSFEELSF